MNMCDVRARRTVYLYNKIVQIIIHKYMYIQSVQTNERNGMRAFIDRLIGFIIVHKL